MFFKLLSVCLCVLFNSWVNGAHIQFYRNSDYTGLYHESGFHIGCNKIPDPHTTIRSIVTDTCVIIYHGTYGIDCKTIKAQKILPGNSTTNYIHTNGYTQCNENVGGLQLNIDIVKPSHTHAGYLLNDYEPIKSHWDVCTCVNIPQNVQQMELWAIQNNHNDYVAYFEPDCSERNSQRKLILEGQTWFSKSVSITRNETITTTKIVKSFGPSFNSTYYKHSCNIKQKILDLQGKNDQLEQKLAQLAINFNDSQVSMLAFVQKQNEKFLKLEQKYNETERKSENYGKIIHHKLDNYNNDKEDKLEELRNEFIYRNGQ